MKETWQYFSWQASQLCDLERRMGDGLTEAYKSFSDELQKVESYDPDDRIYTRNWANKLREVLNKWCNHIEIIPSIASVYDITQKRNFYHGWSLDLNPMNAAKEIIDGVRKRQGSDDKVLRPLCLERANLEIMKWLSERPNDIDRVHDRSFEAIVAEVISNKGWKVELTKRTRDGGYDILCLKADELGFPVTMIVETKLYGFGHSVGLPIVDRLMGVSSRIEADRALVVTNSRFTIDVWKHWEHRVNRDLGLIDRQELIDWLRQYSLENWSTI